MTQDQKVMLTTPEAGDRTPTVDKIYCPFCREPLTGLNGEYWCRSCNITIRNNPWRIMKHKTHRS